MRLASKVIKPFTRLTPSEQLGYTGLLPFVVITLLFCLGFGEVLELFKLYSLTILAFMTGGVWGAIQQQGGDTDSKKTYFLQTSIFLYLLGLLAYFLPDIYAVLLLGASFTILIGLEQSSLFVGYSATYRWMRKVLSVVVISCHGVILFTLL